MQYQQFYNSQDNEQNETEQCMICQEYFQKEILKEHQSKCENFSDDRLMEEYKFYNEQIKEPDSQFFSVIKKQDQKKDTTQNQFSLKNDIDQPKIVAANLLQSVKNNIQVQPNFPNQSPLHYQNNQQNIQLISYNQQRIQEFKIQEEQLIHNEIQPQNLKNEQKIQQIEQKQIIIQEIKKEQNLNEEKDQQNFKQFRNNLDFQKSAHMLYTFKQNNFLPNYIPQNQKQIQKSEQPIQSQQTVKQLNKVQEQTKLQEMKQEPIKQEVKKIFQSPFSKCQKDYQGYLKQQTQSSTPNKNLQQQSLTEREQKKQQNQQSNNKEKINSPFNYQSIANNPFLSKETNKKDEKNFNQTQQWQPRQYQQPIQRQRQVESKKKSTQEDKQFQVNTPIQKKKFEYKPGMRLTDREVEKLTQEELYEYFTQLDLEEQVGFKSKIFLIDNKKIQINENQQCSVCLEDIQPSKEPIDIKLDCKHFFHYDCIKKWLQLHKHCPLCKGEVELFQ